MPLINFPLFDRVRAYLRPANFYGQENVFQNQDNIERIVQGGQFIELSKAGLLEQTNLQINRLERYKDYDMMDEVGEISLGLDIFADECSLCDSERKHCVIVRSKNKRIREMVEDFLYNTILIDREARPIIRYLCKYGDYACEIVPTKNRDGVASTRTVNVYNFTRVQTKYGDLVGFYYQDPNTMSPLFLHPWQVCHMRLANYEGTFAPYGRALLDPVRKDFKRLRLMEDAALIYRVSRASEKRIFTIPVGNIPAHQVQQYMMEIARQFKKKRFVDPATGQVNERWNPLTQEDDFFLPQRCISLETKILLMDGRTRTMQELISEYGIQKDKFWIYSWDGKQIVPKLAKCVQGPKQSKMVRVNLDDGTYIDCTPDHKFYLRNGDVVEASNLKNGDSLYALYRRKAKLRSGETSDYEQVLNPITEEWQFTHRLAVPNCPINTVRHHKNFDRFDNRPDNLEIIGFKSHIKLYSEHGKEIMDRLLKQPEMKEKFLLGTQLGIAKYNNSERAHEEDKSIRAPFIVDKWKFGDYKHTIGKNHVKYVNLDQYREMWRELLRKNYGSARPACREWNSDENNRKIWEANHVTLLSKINEWGYNTIKEFCGYDHKSSNNWRILLQYRDEVVGLVAKFGPRKAATLFNEKYWQKTSKRIMSSFAKEHGWTGGRGEIRNRLSDNIILAKIREYGSVSKLVAIENISKNTCTAAVKRSGYSSIREFLTQPVNHKVVSVVELSELHDTYCLEVDDTHCFFAGSGVLIHNSDGVGPKIETLPGAANLDQIEDILYFKKKIIAGMKIPFSRVGLADPTDADSKSLSSSSPEFAKAVQWIQREFALGLKKVVIVHLALQGCTIDEIKSIDLSMTASSAIDELYRIETWASRADVISDLLAIKAFPERWVFERFTDMTEDEIREVEQQRKEQKERIADVVGMEAVDEDDAKLIAEYKDMKPISKPEKQPIVPLEWYLNSNELDDLPGKEDKQILVESKIPKIDAETAIREYKAMLEASAVEPENDA